MMQVQLCALPQNMDPVTASRYVFVVQGLVNIAHEMDDELGCLCAQPQGHGRVKDLRSVVLNGCHNTTLFLAVAVKINRTVVRRVILGIDEMEDAREVTPFGVPDGVGPSGDASQVILVAISEKGLEIMCRLRLDEIAGDVRDSDMTEAYFGLLVHGRFKDHASWA